MRRLLSKFTDFRYNTPKIIIIIIIRNTRDYNVHPSPSTYPCTTVTVIFVRSRSSEKFTFRQIKFHRGVVAQIKTPAQSSDGYWTGNDVIVARASVASSLATCLPTATDGKRISLSPPPETNFLQSGRLVSPSATAAVSDLIRFVFSLYACGFVYYVHNVIQLPPLPPPAPNFWRTRDGGCRFDCPPLLPVRTDYGYILVKIVISHK